MKFHRVFLLLILPLYFFSCTPQQKVYKYLENVSDTNGTGIVKIPELRIQKNDLLSIQIHSLSTQPLESDMIFNQISTTNTTGTTNVNTGGYLVDVDGNIEHHRLGVIHAEGLTKQQLAAEIKKRLTVPVELLKDPTVIIRFMNFKVSVMGDVTRPGDIQVPGERITILQAIGLSGDITQYGLKTNVKVLRELDGKREIGKIDLTSKDLFDSPFYNLYQNDIVIVESSGRKERQEDQALMAQKVSIALSIATVVFSIAQIFIGLGNQ
jgi:polysaccharide export outer membrane protein